jgi:glycosyltransferase involved in cell wall biosynthesis
LAIAASELLRERHPSRDGYARPLVTVVLAGHNERKVVRRCVRSLREQTHDRLEIICVDDGSSDGMSRELQSLRDNRLIDAALSTSLRCGKSSACNLGISRARGELVVVTDCDCTFDRDAILHMIAPFADPSVGAVHAEQLPEEFRKVFQPRGRSQVARITLAEGTTFPLFAKVRLSGIGWLSPGTFVRAWLERSLRPAAESGGEARPASGV